MSLQYEEYSDSPPLYIESKKEKSVLEEVADFIENKQLTCELNSRQSEALSSAKSLIICSDEVDKCMNSQ